MSGPIIPIPTLAHLYMEGRLDDEHILSAYGQEVLDAIIHYLTDPFTEVLGG